jgi:hypothetical protein
MTKCWHLTFHLSKRIIGIFCHHDGEFEPASNYKIYIDESVIIPVMFDCSNIFFNWNVYGNYDRPATKWAIVQPTLS